MMKTTYLNRQSVYRMSKFFLVLTCLGVGSVLPAQSCITLQSALDSSQINNLGLKNEKLKVQYQALMTRTGADIPQTILFSENGQLNSRYTDYRFGAIQTLKFPTVYTKQRNVFNKEYTISTTNLTLKTLDLKKEVITTYYHLAYLQEKEDILLKNDTVYAIFQDRSILRFKAGESNVLERTTAEVERSQIAMQLRELQQDKAIYLLQLQWLMNTQSQYMPELAVFKMQLPSYDSNLIAKHPQIRILMQEREAAQARTELERNKLLPDLNIQYSNMSMYGVGADNEFYNYAARFQAVQVGIGIPLFSGSQRATIRASESQEKIAESDYAVALNTLNNHWEQTVALYLKYQETLHYYETIGLKNADLMITTINQQFSAGEINYLNWVTLTNQALGVKSDYLDAVNNYNETIIELTYLMGQ